MTRLQDPIVFVCHSTRDAGLLLGKDFMKMMEGLHQDASLEYSANATFIALILKK